MRFERRRRCRDDRSRRAGPAVAAGADRDAGSKPVAVEAAPTLAEQLTHVRALYDDVCRHYGLRIGLKHARKHLGWALEIAAQCSRAPAATLKGWRQKILDVGGSAPGASIAPGRIRRFCMECCRMTSAAEHRRPVPSDSEAILNALPNPVGRFACRCRRAVRSCRRALRARARPRDHGVLGRSPIWCVG